MRNGDWRGLLDATIRLAREGRLSAYQLAGRVSKLLKDTNYKQMLEREGKNPLDELLPFVRHLCVANATELAQMFKMFPREEQWVNGDLAAMRMEMVRALASKTGRKPVSVGAGDVPGASGGDENPGVRLSWKKRCLDALEENRVLKARVRQMERGIKHLREIIRGLGGNAPSDN
jgi:hypothetical protein